MTNEQVAELFNDSLERCRRLPEFLDVFYGNLMAASPDVAAFFEHTDFRHQKRMLTMALYVLLAGAEGDPGGLAHIEAFAASHAKRGIQPAHYDVWLVALLATVAKLDPAFTPETGDAWRRVLAPAIKVMQAAASVRS